MTTVAALYVDPRGCYAGLSGVDVWDESRDARTYAGPHPVVAHPPCSRWCRLAGLVEARDKRFKANDDGGCFAAALDAVRRWGGVLEHPAQSRAWKAHGLAPPTMNGWQYIPDGSLGGWVCQVDQSHYGHRARKRTWLYAVVWQPPRLIWGDGVGSTPVEKMSKRERNATPEAFRDVLIAIARDRGPAWTVDKRRNPAPRHNGERYKSSIRYGGRCG